MLKSLIATTLISGAAFASISSASADVAVSVGSNDSGARIHGRPVVASRHKHVYYSGSYAYVARNQGSTFVHAYPGVDVFVGPGGDVNVNVGY